MNWKKVKLGDICQMNSGGTPSRSKSAYYGGNILWAKISDIESAKTGIITETEEKITEEGLKAINNRIFEANTLLLAMYGSVGKTAITGCRLSTNQAILGIRPLKDDIISLQFLKYWLQHKKEELLNRAVGGTLQNISLGIVKNLEIPLPPLKTQKHIAEVLDKADALRQQNRQLLAQYDELLQSTFIELFGDPVKNPKGWEVKKLDKVCTQITDGTHFSPPSVDSGVPYITAKHVKNYGVDFYSKPTYVSIEEHVKIYSRCKPEKGDVLYIKDGATTGIAAVNPYDFEFSMLSSLALIKPQKKELTSQFLVSWLNSEQVKENLINEFMAGAAIKRFTLQKIKSFQIPVPPLQLQQRFANIVEKIEAQKAEAQAALAESEALFEGLLAGYFNA